MKGIIFTEFLSLVETAFGEDMVDSVLDKADLPSGGAFTSVGNYPCEELIEMVTVLSNMSGIDGAKLQEEFGAWMMDMFEREYPGFFEGKATSFELLESVDREIHVEVQKLYPDAELPRFETERTAPDAMKMVYKSPRPLEHFCKGLIKASVANFDETASIDRCPNSTESTDVTFNIKLEPKAINCD